VRTFGFATFISSIIGVIVPPFCWVDKPTGAIFGSLAKLIFKTANGPKRGRTKEASTINRKQHVILNSFFELFEISGECSDPT
jgi:hypothetical protein